MIALISHTDKRMIETMLKTGLCCYIMGLSLVFLEPGTITAADLEPAESVLNKIDDGSKKRNIYQNLKQIITEPSGRKKIVNVDLYCIDKGERRIYHYLSPAWVKGIIVNIEKKGNAISVTSPFKKDTRDIQPVNRSAYVMESDFTYEDLASFSWGDHYAGMTLRMEEEGGVPCLVLSLRPVYDGSAYTRLVMWVDMKEYSVVRIDYYQKNESTPFKQMLCKEFRVVGNTRVCTEVHMQHLYNGRNTLQMVTEMRFDEDVDYSRINESSGDQ